MPHVQIVTWTWTCNWEWPPFVLSLKEWVGGLIQIDINTVAKPECTALRGGFASTATAFALMGAVLLLAIGLGIKHRCAKRKAAWQAAAARAHIVSYGLALYTLAFPVLVKQAVRWLDWSLNGEASARATVEAGCAEQLFDPAALDPCSPSHPDDGWQCVYRFEDCSNYEELRQQGLDGDGVSRWKNNEVPRVTNVAPWEMNIAVALGALWLLVIAVIVPVVCFRAMRRHREANRLHSAAVHARLGWLYDKYTDEAYWYELVSCALWLRGCSCLG